MYSGQHANQLKTLTNDEYDLVPDPCPVQVPGVVAASEACYFLVALWAARQDDTTSDQVLMHPASQPTLHNQAHDPLPEHLPLTFALEGHLRPLLPPRLDVDLQDFALLCPGA